MPDLERRTAVCRETAFETRAEGDELHISGYFAVFGPEYELWPGCSEQVDRHAFDSSAGRDVRALTNHDSTLVLGRSAAGTFVWKTDDHGLWGDITLNAKDQDALNLYARVERKDVTQCSFGFEIVRREIVDKPDGSTLIRLLEVRLWEVSVCTFPAYEATEVEARRRDVAQHRAEKSEIWRRQALRRLKGD